MNDLSCPAYKVDYENTRCFKLDRNTQGRNNELAEADGVSYFEKSCVRCKLSNKFSCI